MGIHTPIQYKRTYKTKCIKPCMVYMNTWAIFHSSMGRQGIGMYPGLMRGSSVCASNGEQPSRIDNAILQLVRLPVHW